STRPPGRHRHAASQTATSPPRNGTTSCPTADTARSVDETECDNSRVSGFCQLPEPLNELRVIVARRIQGVMSARAAISFPTVNTLARVPECARERLRVCVQTRTWRRPPCSVFPPPRPTPLTRANASAHWKGCVCLGLSPLGPHAHASVRG